ncbi:LEAF RUST 10 DISEASE-RESISTANCE LOCUS RECEPTOR-LIKE PROTEIN KINASE-like 1.2 isoform X2 [Cryptomeria japonica]|uniref:LEAF RUST 10 DISEASE-RESISTANCE LOCUS RECEPTOR-LIKE PROTEIN KINASE-like 1.2 isoform X2 n=1 Tax=Cryptomeria japonica TaxID=3369 RepID=UPI0025AC499D|nr:LEAF RUST 10 DISEASE-RESISTANCE LOCUS RECEPTOR-LIKE PROTEIN KINASE-like 1.2 isoform X2 [Cryptomeria japonica]
MEALPVLPLSLHLSCSLPSSSINGRPLRFFCLLFTIMIFWLSSHCDGACIKPFRCGFYSLDYPFGWKNSGCGDPTLQLDCDSYLGMPLISISGHQYYIRLPTIFSAENSSQSMTIIDNKLWGSSCDPSSSNSTAQFWSSSQFHIANGYKNITLGEQCEQENLPSNASKLECSDDWYYVPTSNLSLATVYCKSYVQLPVNIDPKLPRSTSLTEIVQQGFEIEWDFSRGCENCVSRNGTCNYNTTTMKPFCHTEDAILNLNTRNKSRFIVILVCSMGGVALVAVIVLLCIYNWKRRNLPAKEAIANRFNKYQEMGVCRPEYTTSNVSKFSYKELQEATNFFDEKNELGDGGSGAVYMGKLLDGRVVAVKRLYQDNNRREEQFINEVHILSTLRHPNLVQLYGCTHRDSPILLLVYEFVANGTLADHLHGNRRTPKGLPWQTRLNIAIETAQALAFLHSINPPIFHRDVKSNNILLDENFRAKVADFGLSRSAPFDVSHITTAPQGTPGYVDPDYHHRFQLTDKSDVYSFGVVLVELISAKVAVDTKREDSEISLAYMALDKIRSGALDELVDPDLKVGKKQEVKLMVSAVAELAFRCLACDRDVRPDMREVVARLEEIKEMDKTRVNKEQDSLSKESSKLISDLPPVSPISVHEKWPSTPSYTSEMSV